MINECCSDDKNQVEISKQLLSMEDAEKMAVLFKIFADNTRIRIIQIISLGEICVHEIAHNLGLSQSAVSHQLRQLRQYNLVATRRLGKHMYYSLKDEHIFSIFENVLEHVQEPK